MTNKILNCLWFNGDAEEAANFYAQTFSNSKVTGVYRAPGDYPAGKQAERRAGLQAQ
jgi:predicted 3-demethylubiquinone-9 3-methyltransferase (glyoxalase superfamily)